LGLHRHFGLLMNLPARVREWKILETCVDLVASFSGQTVGYTHQAEELGSLRAQVVARSSQEAAASQRPRPRARQQARSHCLERPGSWSSIRGNQDSGCVISTRVVEKSLTSRGLREDENEMEDRSSRRTRTLVTQMSPASGERRAQAFAAYG